MSELEDKLNIALANVETVKQMIMYRKANEKNQDKVNCLANYNLELLDLKLRLKDMIKNLHTIEEE
jgi:hypothetical protein